MKSPRLILEIFLVLSVAAIGVCLLPKFLHFHEFSKELSTPKLHPTGFWQPPIKEIHRVELKTEVGSLEIEVYPQAAPHAAARFLELVKLKFFDNTPIFAVKKGFVAEFGVNSNQPSWENCNVTADPPLFKPLQGTLVFSCDAHHTFGSNIILNYQDNSHWLDQGIPVCVFGRVVRGFEKASLFREIGIDSAGLDEAELWHDTVGYLKRVTVHPTMILSAIEL